MDRHARATNTGVPREAGPRVPTGADDRPDDRGHDLSAQHRRVCARPGCAAPAEATLAFVYDQRIAVLAALAVEPVPQAYDLCARHAARTRAPRGWSFDDRRPRGGPVVHAATTTSADLGGDRTVAVLAAALRAVPDPVSEDALAPAAEAARVPTRPPLALRPRADGA